MRALFIFCLLGCIATVAPTISFEEACAGGGPMALEYAWSEPENLTTWWEILDGRFSAVLARRTTEAQFIPVLRDPNAEPGGDLSFLECNRGAEHEIVDGLGWIDAETIQVRARTP
ncbi:MAG: hypothetical protein ACI9KE_001375 [Polyangiales bacterium]